MTFGIHKVGKELHEANRILVSATEKDLYRFGNKRIPLVSFIRDTIWWIGTWKNKKLKKWVEEYNPEETKGNELIKESYQLLKEKSEELGINFVGSVEGRDAFSGKLDMTL